MKLKLYMKSGNQIMITHVEDLRIRYQGDVITMINIDWAKNAPKTGVMIQSIALREIEAIEAI